MIHCRVTDRVPNTCPPITGVRPRRERRRNAVFPIQRERRSHSNEGKARALGNRSRSGLILINQRQVDARLTNRLRRAVQNELSQSRCDTNREAQSGKSAQTGGDTGPFVSPTEPAPPTSQDFDADVVKCPSVVSSLDTGAQNCDLEPLSENARVVRWRPPAISLRSASRSRSTVDALIACAADVCIT